MKSRWLCGLLFVCLLGGLPVRASIAASPADPGKVLRYIFPVEETGFDPAYVSDIYSSIIVDSIFEGLFTYDYLARPAKLIPLTAEALPEVTNEGKTYTIRLKKGIYFAPDPAFNGKQRELTMADYVYSLKRLVDPKLRSYRASFIEGKVVGLDDVVAQARKNGNFDYDRKVAGLELLDRYTLRIHLTKPDYNLEQILAHPATGALAREVVEKYRDEAGHVMDHPVGTGPYRLTEWVHASRIVLEANPAYRGFTWDFQASSDPEDQAIIARMKGKKMPQIGRIEISVMIENQSQWLAFEKDEVDLFQLQEPLAPQALTNGKLKPELVKRGVQLSRIADPELAYFYWNMQHPVLGGLSKEKIALRRALAMAHNIDEELKIVWNSEAVALEYPIPPGVVGHDPAYKSSIQFDLAAANALLDKFGYKKGADGYRTLPDGKPLVVRHTVRAGSLGQLELEMWKKTYNSVGIRMEGDTRPFADLLKAEKQCLLQSRRFSWLADYPDGDNFMALFYGPNIGQSNGGCVKIPEYDKMYEQTRKLPHGPERDLLYHKMVRLLEVYAPQRLGFARYHNMLAQSRVIGYKKHPILSAEWMYFDIEKR